MNTECGLTPSVQKTKLMAFKERVPVQTKITIDKIVEQVHSYNYARNFISTEQEVDIDKLYNDLQRTGTINNI
jgi:hypothetical protein